MTTSLTDDPDSTPAADEPAGVRPVGVPSQNQAAPDLGGVPIFPSVDPVNVATPGWDRGAAPYPPPPTGAYYPGYPYPGAQPGPGGPQYAYPPIGWPQPTAMTAPAAWPVVVFTLFFGIFGAISAGRRQSEANELGLSGRRYWWTFAGSLVGGAVLWLLALGIVVAVAVPLFQASRHEVMTVDQLESNLRASNDAGVAVSDARCTEQAVTDTGAGTYDCQVTFANGAAQAYLVTVNEDGTWAVQAD